MIKKYWAYFLLIFAVVFFLYKSSKKQSENFEVETFSINSGWGYNILKNSKIYIHQEIIPAVSGKKNFANREDAEKVGKCVVEKMKSGKGGGLPQITLEELDSLRINSK